MITYRPGGIDYRSYYINVYLRIYQIYIAKPSLSVQARPGMILHSLEMTRLFQKRHYMSSSSGQDQDNALNSQSIPQIENTEINVQENLALKSSESRPGLDEGLPPLPRKVEIQEPESTNTNSGIENQEIARNPSVPVLNRNDETTGVGEETVENLRNNTAINNQNTWSNVHPQQEMNQEDEVEEGDDAGLALDPNHPLLDRVQKAIYEQLSKHETKLLLEVREKEEITQKEVKRREDLGVELYTLQQNLARLQATFEGAEEN